MHKISGNRHFLAHFLLPKMKSPTVGMIWSQTDKAYLSVTPHSSSYTAQQLGGRCLLHPDVGKELLARVLQAGTEDVNLVVDDIVTLYLFWC